MIAIVNTLAAQIRKNFKGTTRSASMKQAWEMILKNPEATVIRFKKKTTGEETTRVVSEKWYNFKTPAGGESKLKDGQKPYADLLKVVIGVTNPIISIYQNSIL